MTDEPAGGKLHIDSDWKTEAAEEKERLAREEQRRTEDRSGSTGEATFAELVNLLMMQAAVALGGMQTPGGEKIPPNPAAARHFIDLLQLLRQKTEGKLTDDEKRLLDGVTYELQMQYVQAVSPPAAPTEPTDA